jgi:SPP1 gp7 family putative phage head morphogenesis protein
MAAPSQPPKPKPRPPKIAGPESEYGVALRRIAGHVGHVIEVMQPHSPAIANDVAKVLTAYADSLEDWGQSVATRMISTVNQRSRKDWKALSQNLSVGLRQVVTGDDAVATTVRQLLADQVSLIKSLPLEAAQRVQKLALDNALAGGRSEAIINEIMATGFVTRNRATLISRTETSRAHTVLTQARAQSIGSEGYRWRTSKDQRVRPSHAKMEGKFVRWDSPPTLDNLTGHAGCLPRCRCFCDVLVPE